MDVYVCMWIHTTNEIKIRIDSHKGRSETLEKAFVTGRNWTAFLSPQAISSCGNSVLHLDPAEDTGVWGLELWIVLLCPNSKHTLVKYPSGFWGDSLEVVLLGS